MLFRFAYLAIFCIFFVGCAHQERKVKTQKELEGYSYYYLIRSNLEAYKGDLPQAIEDLEKALKKYPSDPYLRFLVAERYAENRQWDEASKNVEAALKSKPAWDNAKMLLGRILDAKGESQKAARMFEEAIRANPESEESYLRLAQSLVDQKKYNQAIQVLQKWIARKPESTSAYFYIAGIQNTFLRNPDLALKTYQRILKVEPDNLRVRQIVAQIYLDKDKLKEALEQLLEVEHRYSHDLGVQLQIASIYYDLGNPVEAITRLQNILKINPKADRIHYYLGLILEKTKNIPESIEHYAAVPPASSLFKDAVLRRASIYRDLKKNDDAIKVVKQGVSKSEKISEFYFYLSFLYEEKKEFNEAINVLKQGVKSFPESEQFYFNLGTLYDRAQNKTESVAMMRKVLTLNPSNASALNYIGYTFAEEKNNLEEAENLIRKALKIKPGDGYILDSLGWVYFQKGDLDKAYQYIQKAFRVLPKDPTIVEHIGDIFLKKGNKQEALKYFRKALEYNKAREEPNLDEIKRVEEKLQELTK